MLCSNNIRRGQMNCCVFQCGNKYGNTPKTVSFYSFPRDNYISRSRREKWINAIKRKNSDGTPWVPTKHSKICSEHFTGGKKSEHPHHPAYVPTIFSTHKAPFIPTHDSRFQRLKNRVKTLTIEKQLEETIEDCFEVRLMEEIGCRTEDKNTDYTEENLDKTFVCCLYMKENSSKVDSATQTIIVNKQQPGSMKDVKCGPDDYENDVSG